MRHQASGTDARRPIAGEYRRTNIRIAGLQWRLATKISSTDASWESMPWTRSLSGKGSHRKRALRCKDQGQGAREETRLDCRLSMAVFHAGYGATRAINGIVRSRARQLARHCNVTAGVDPAVVTW